MLGELGWVGCRSREFRSISDNPQMHSTYPSAMSAGKPGQRGGGWSEPCLKQSWTGRITPSFFTPKISKACWNMLKSQSEMSRLWMSHTQTGRAVTLKKHFEVMSQIPHSIYFYTAETASVWSAKNRATMPKNVTFAYIHRSFSHVVTEFMQQLEQLYQVWPP